MNPEVDTFLNNATTWQEEMRLLRSILLDSPLDEAVKWRTPCYTFQKKNVVLLSRFKEYCALSFFKGALLTDPNDILRKPGENTQAARIIRFTTIQEIRAQKPILKAYISEAIEIEKSGLRVAPREDANRPFPEELQVKLDEDTALKSAFESLTPGRQRAYLLHFNAAKQSKTRTSRIEKYTPRILDGKGINDCTCGHSKKMPNCDGSHKHFR